MHQEHLNHVHFVCIGDLIRLTFNVHCRSFSWMGRHICHQNGLHTVAVRGRLNLSCWEDSCSRLVDLAQVEHCRHLHLNLHGLMEGAKARTMATNHWTVVDWTNEDLSLMVRASQLLLQEDQGPATVLPVTRAGKIVSRRSCRHCPAPPGCQHLLRCITVIPGCTPGASSRYRL